MTTRDALRSLMDKFYELCQETNCNEDQYQRYNTTSENAILERVIDALDILIGKSVDIGCLTHAFTYVEKDKQLKFYNTNGQYCFGKGHNYLTQDEFDLIEDVIKQDYERKE